jgi:hypothetical protein
MPDRSPSPSWADQHLERTLQQLVSESDAQLRWQLVDRATQPPVSMRAGATAEHRQPGWYAAREPGDLAAMGYPVLGWDLEFPAPAACATWHEAEFDAERGLVYRFFVRSAWLSLTPPAGATGLRVRVLFGLHGQAIRETEVYVDDVPVTYRGEVEADGCKVLNIGLAVGATYPIAVRLDCGYSGVPSRLFPGATDERLLSAAVARPEWLFEKMAEQSE